MVGELTPMELLPQVCDAVDFPVIAAGGRGDGRGLEAVLFMGGPWCTDRELAFLWLKM
jgi:enoyl-[acyl-carrier protein] reductase II